MNRPLSLAENGLDLVRVIEIVEGYGDEIYGDDIDPEGVLRRIVADLRRSSDETVNVVSLGDLEDGALKRWFSDRPGPSAGSLRKAQGRVAAVLRDDHTTILVPRGKAHWDVLVVLPDYFAWFAAQVTPKNYAMHGLHAAVPQEESPSEDMMEEMYSDLQHFLIEAVMAVSWRVTTIS
jgi:hypothetical protein